MKLHLTRNQIDNLLQVEDGLRFLRNCSPRSYAVVNNPSNVMTVCDGFLLHAQDNNTVQGTSCAMLFYARETAARVLSFHVFFPVGEVYAMAIEPCMDLIAVLAPITDEPFVSFLVRPMYNVADLVSGLSVRGATGSCCDNCLRLGVRTLKAATRLRSTHQLLLDRRRRVGRLRVAFYHRDHCFSSMWRTSSGTSVPLSAL